jgi:hypothetical protein
MRRKGGNRVVIGAVFLLSFIMWGHGHAVTVVRLALCRFYCSPAVYLFVLLRGFFFIQLTELESSIGDFEVEVKRFFGLLNVSDCI